MTVRTTFALDTDTAQALDRLAARWGVSRSEALRRAVAAASQDQGVDSAGEALAGLDALQERMALEGATADRWIRSIRAERRAGKP